jgi:hypothetical protein
MGETIMTYVFGAFSIVAFVFALSALAKVNKLEKLLSDKEGR